MDITEGNPTKSYAAYQSCAKERPITVFGGSRFKLGSPLMRWTECMRRICDGGLRHQRETKTGRTLHHVRPANTYGWGRGIRTPVTGTKNPGPAAGRCPKAALV